MSIGTESQARLALPGKGTMEATTLTFLAESGLKVSRSNPRQYLARISSLPELEVVFQRATDVPGLVYAGDALLGITGYDILAEYRRDGGADPDERDDDLLLLVRDLGYGACRLVVAVPETWIDVSTCADLWHLAGYYQTHKQRGLRIATKYPALTKQFLRQHGITHCKIISPHGALEAAPLTGTADLIVDLTETGTTLRENRLKLLSDGVVLRSQACLIANRRLLCESPSALQLTRTLLELIDARMQARQRSLLTAYLHAPEAQVRAVLKKHPWESLTMTTRFDYHISHASGSELPSGADCVVSGVVSLGGAASELLEIVTLLRSAGAERIDMTPLSFRFGEVPASVRLLNEKVAKGQ